MRSLLNEYYDALKSKNRFSKFFEDEILRTYELTNDYASILINGQVQSGKTAFMIGCICKFLDEGYDDVILLGGTNIQLLGQSVGRLYDEVMVSNKLHVVDSREDISKSKNAEMLEGKTIFTVMKEKTNLENLLIFMKSARLVGKKILVLDDEADYGSTNNGNNKNYSKIHDDLIKIMNSNNLVKYVAVTATPFANILSEQDDVLYPNGMLNMLPNESYTGNRFFINSGDYKILDINPIEFINNDKEVKNIIVDFIALAAVRKCNNIRKHQLLLNIDVRNGLQEALRKKILENIKAIFTDRQVLFKNALKEYNNVCKVDEAYKQTLLYLSALNENPNLVKINNSNNKSSINENECEIIIGGVLLSRGVTYENLAIEVLLNTPKENIAIDTLLQKARWFGYREKTYKFMRILMPSEALVAYELYEDILKILLGGKKYGEKLYADDISSIRNSLLSFAKKYKKEIKLSNKKIKSDK